MGVQTARSLTPHKRRRAVALANGHYESIIMTVGITRWKPTTSGGRWVFPGRYDHSVPMNSIRPGWLRLCSAAGVTALRPHDLRHNFVSMLQARGIADSIIMSITGHKTHVMLHRYSHSTDALRLAAVEEMPAPKPAEGDNVVAIARRPDRRQTKL